MEAVSRGTGTGSEARSRPGKLGVQRPASPGIAALRRPAPSQFSASRFRLGTGPASPRVPTARAHLEPGRHWVSSSSGRQGQSWHSDSGIFSRYGLYAQWPLLGR